MAWREVFLTTAQIVDGKMISLQEEFQSLFLAAGGPRGMALFCGKKTASGNFLYFSPGSLPHASSLISVYSGIPCEKPPWSGLPDRKIALLVGHADAWDLLR